MNILFSVLIPAFKAKYLREAIDSILCQTYNNFEIIVVNDASPENLDEIIESYVDDRIKYFKNDQNFGAYDVVKNWNKCLSYANGDYVICIGDDDRLKPICLEVYHNEIIKRPGIGIIHGWTELINSKSEVIALTSKRCEYESAISLFWHKTFSYGSQFVGDFCYNTTLLKSNGGFYYLPMAWGSDEISAVLGADKNGIANTQEIVFQYRTNEQSISRSGHAEAKIIAINEQFEWAKKYLSKKSNDYCDELYRKALISKLPSYYEKKKATLIAVDLRAQTRLRIFYWIKAANKLKITKGSLIYAFLQSFK